MDIITWHDVLGMIGGYMKEKIAVEMQTRNSPVASRLHQSKTIAQDANY